MALEIVNLQANIAADNTPVLKGVDLTVNPGEVHVIMGPNGSGKSTLAKVLLSHPDYEVSSGGIIVDGEDVTDSEPSERSKSGIFLAMQYPTEIPGVNLAHFLRLAYNAHQLEDKKLPVFKFRKLLKEKLKLVDMPESFLERNLNEGFSGGEKKKCEILQALILEPKYLLLDETDSGLDVDAVKTVFSTIQKIIALRKKSMGVIVITHYLRVLDYIQPDFVHVFQEGRILKSGGVELAKQIDERGYKETQETGSGD